jgi:C1A family cysteine protease
MTTADYPYVAANQSCKADPSKFKATVVKFVDLPRGNPFALKDAASSNIVSVAVDANSWFTYKSGIIMASACGSRLNHGVVVVGYGIEDGVKHWIIKNSWGGAWGESGYLRVEDTATTGNGACGINMVNSYADVAKSL